MAVDLKGAEQALSQRTQQHTLEKMQKEQENQEQMQAMESFKALLQKAGQI